MRLILSILAVLTSLELLAQNTGAIGGTVTSAGQPVEFLNVAIPGTTIGAITNAEGEYLITNVPAGKNEFQFSGVGYISKKVNVVAVAGQKVTVNVNLDEDVSQLDEIVITGTMKEVSKMDRPIPVEVFSPTFFILLYPCHASL